MFSIILSTVYSIVRFALLTLMWGVICFLICGSLYVPYTVFFDEQARSEDDIRIIHRRQKPSKSSKKRHSRDQKTERRKNCKTQQTVRFAKEAEQRSFYSLDPTVLLISKRSKTTTKLTKTSSAQSHSHSTAVKSIISGISKSTRAVAPKLTGSFGSKSLPPSSSSSSSSPSHSPTNSPHPRPFSRRTTQLTPKFSTETFNNLTHDIERSFKKKFFPSTSDESLTKSESSSQVKATEAKKTVFAMTMSRDKLKKGFKECIDGISRIQVKGRRASV